MFDDVGDARAEFRYDKIVGAQADIKANGSDNPSPIPFNSSATVSWTSMNATSCAVAPNGWIGLSGSQSTGNLTSNQIYTLSCQPTGPNSTDSVTVRVDTPTLYNLSIIKAGQGTVTSNIAGINCGASCSANYVENTTVILTAEPGSNRIFTGWSGGGCSGRGSCSVFINSPKTVYANFAVNPNYKEF